MGVLTVGGDDDVDVDARVRREREKAARAEGFVVGMGGDDHHPLDRPEVDGRHLLGRDRGRPDAAGGAGIGVQEGHHGSSPVVLSSDPSAAWSRSA